jgi:thiol-disulfide isomerase/thioredoxin
MKTRILLGALALAGLPFTLVAQQTPVPTTPDGCRKDAADWFNTHYTAARAAAKQPGGKPVDVQSLLNDRISREKACAAQFDAATMSGPELLALATLYTDVGRRADAVAAAGKRLRESGLTTDEKADALGAMVALNTAADTASLDVAERYVAQLDAMPASVMAQKITAHARLNGEYRYLDFNSRIRRHSRVLIALGKSLKLTGAPTGPVPMNPATFSVAEAYTDMAEVYSDFGKTDSALMILDQAAKDHPEFSSYITDNLLTPERARFELIGKHAPAVFADHWLNAPAGTHTFDPTGHVTVLEFTAHWCVPCRNSYPGLVEMAKRFEPQGVRFVFATQFYGYVGDQKNLDQAQEMAADSEYYDHEHGIGFPIAVADMPPLPQPNQPYVPNPNDQAYHVGGIPQVVIIDRNGIIRRIITGWDFGNVDRLPPLLASLVGSPIKAAGGR